LLLHAELQSARGRYDHPRHTHTDRQRDSHAVRQTDKPVDDVARDADTLSENSVPTDNAEPLLSGTALQSIHARYDHLIHKADRQTDTQ